MRILSRPSHLLIGLLALGITGCSCVSKKDFDALKAEHAETRLLAQQALDASTEAKQASKDTNARVQRIEEAVNRSFKKSMYK